MLVRCRVFSLTPGLVTRSVRECVAGEGQSVRNRRCKFATYVCAPCPGASHFCPFLPLTREVPGLGRHLPACEPHWLASSGLQAHGARPMTMTACGKRHVRKGTIALIWPIQGSICDFWSVMHAQILPNSPIYEADCEKTCVSLWYGLL